jgi:SAM-dependent methyltransferase
VDISETMVDLARKYNKFGDHCQYYVNLEPDLALFPDDTFDLVYSTIVLQHNPPATAERYIEEFCRVLKPGGVAVFDMTASLNVKQLPDESHRANLVLTAPAPALRAGEQGTVELTVTNVSGLDWPAGCWLAAGNHWVPSGKGQAVQDDGRAVMHEGLAAGASLPVQLHVTAPAVPGSYTLQIDLVEERVAWFADRGSVPVAVDVVVRRPPSAVLQRQLQKFRSRGHAAAEPAAEPAPFSMNGLPRDRVEGAVTRTGCSVADVLPNESGGHHWDGYRYFVTKA